MMLAPPTGTSKHTTRQSAQALTQKLRAATCDEAQKV